ncbi:unnamed protein product [Rotaria magnacalcarata]|uniref:Uncharacterized protein n=3 Tax=Rotaria magnacalcarata TaxID=392030 RepID=A0A819Q9Y4_9BILA|nr:unnamed protein product [Rotaria magnacalcarata]CAF4025978.1 unnamed protein product [Rotaria magnacalcarata]
MPTSTQAVAPYAPRVYQGLAEETNDVSYTPNQTTVREVQWNMADLPSASSSESATTTSWKPLIIVLTAVILVAAIAAVATPFLIAYFKTGSELKKPIIIFSNSISKAIVQLMEKSFKGQQKRAHACILLQHQQQVQQLLLQQQRRQQQPQRRPLPLRRLRPQPLRVRTSINNPHQQSVTFLFLLATTTTTTANLPAACSSYTTISDSTRSVSYSGSSGCDSSSFSSSGMWVRFTGSGGTTIPTYAPGTSVCGTSATGWYASTVPSSGATASGTLCYQWTSSTCQWSSSVQVANCNTYYVYLLYPSPTCNLRVCTV